MALKMYLNKKTIKIHLIMLFILLMACIQDVFAKDVKLAPVPSGDAIIAAENSNSDPLKETNITEKADNIDKKAPEIKELIVNKEPELPADNDDSGIMFNINNEKKPELRVSEPVKKIDGQLFESEDEKKQYTFQKQKEMDVEDIRLLWESTVERNTVIKFALKKLAMPADQRRIHSSMMAKTVSTLISGVAILPNIFGLDSITSTASMAGGSLANRIIQNKTMPKVMPLTDSELIQLAKLITDLQDKIINNYYEYKSSLEALRVCRQNLILQNKNYSEALNSKNSIAIIAASSLYDKELLNELRLKQQIKLKRLELERLAGEEIVSKLSLTKVASVEVNPVKTKEKVKQAVSEEAKK
ncbi:MAG: hypothetical protein A2104_03155 [Candidatus Melainabacteria bacterium GWF2_32_7]|nr:MAG: hypothetical protein A2104_03155 [Candidatus Melainabacteria bacterium GWF2_32_7]